VPQFENAKVAPAVGTSATVRWPRAATRSRSAGNRTASAQL